MNKEETRFLIKWAQIKERGQWHYIITRGLLWGVFVSVFSYLFQSWDELKAWDTAALANGFTSSGFFVKLFIYNATGIGIHAYHWNSNSKRYNQLRNIERRVQAESVATK